MNEISVPMPFEKNFIDKLVSINNQIEKSKITNVYFALPLTDKDKSLFEQTRTYFKKITDFNYWKEIILYARDKGFEFIYLLNSPKPLLYESPYLLKQLDKLDKLINKLRSEDLKKLRLSNIQLMAYIAKHYPDMELYVSTSFEYTQIQQIQNLILKFPQIKQIVPSHDVNKNFKLLETIRKQYPKIDVEIMLNEGCMRGCPFRFWHAMSVSTIFNPRISELDEDLTSNWFTKNCSYLRNNIDKLCLASNIYPWEIEEYNKIGINQFKLVGRSSQYFANGQYFDYYLNYLKGIDNCEKINEVPLKNLVNYFSEQNWNVKVKDIKPYLPNIKHFVKNGHLCASICGSECTYCYQCAENIRQNLKNYF